MIIWAKAYTKTSTMIRELMKTGRSRLRRKPETWISRLPWRKPTIFHGITEDPQTKSLPMVIMIRCWSRWTIGICSVGRRRCSVAWSTHLCHQAKQIASLRAKPCLASRRTETSTWTSLIQSFPSSRRKRITRSSFPTRLIWVSWNPAALKSKANDKSKPSCTPQSQSWSVNIHLQE